jgi:hypothetical protein
MVDVEITQEVVPRTLDADRVSRLSTLLAVSFFRAALERGDGEPMLFARYLTPTYLMQHEPDVASAETIIRRGDFCPPGQGCAQ